MAYTDLIGYDELDAVIARLGLGIGASEVHGSLCGFLAGGGKPGKRSLLATLHLDAGGVTGTAEDQNLLDRLVSQSEAELSDIEMGFEPVLPADDRPLSERADALVDWCRGFLGGFGLGGPDIHARLSEEAQEILRDISTIAASSLDFDEENEDEDALIEVHEFVRMGAMLLFTEGNTPDRSGSGTVH